MCFFHEATLADIWCQDFVLLEDQLKSSMPKSDSARSRAYETGAHLHRNMSENLTEMRCRDVVSAGIRELENDIPLIFVITATYKRYTQKVELVRFSQVLRQVPNILWIVVEDGENKTTTIAEFLANSGVPHVYLSVAGTKQHNVRPKGLIPQNRGLQYVRESLKVNPRPSVIYVADDDNTYTLRLFKEVSISTQLIFHIYLMSVINMNMIWLINTLRPRQNGRHFADDTFKPIFLNENSRFSIKISLKFIPKAPINSIPSLVQIMAWRRPGDRPLSEPMIVCLLTHICVTRPQ